ncbi:MAG: serine hydroxymethyltransferase [Proteobacteria bacterium]|nr:serine hydroxymethyltransferase [Pseudomonadota bacterium]
MPDSPGRTVYFEHRPLGAYVRVAAICAETGTEVVVMGPVNAALHDLERLARRKLERRLAQDTGEGA